ncbi:MAG: c-type cytochrome [Bryobacterales bacterium]|nr:c-type cytochrome [Bryobacterales bacterium]
MKKNKYLLLFSSLGVAALLLAAAMDENLLRDWRRIQSEGRNEEGPIKVQLRQIVNPRLRSSDRCVSCHVTMGPGEQSVTGSKILTAHKKVVHDPAEYGCTICHGGQGLATEKADAHGDVHFWPTPMIPVQYAYAGCGTCHAPLHVPNRDTYRAAVGVFERLDCLACHRVDNRGGTIRPGGGGMEGPDLSRAGITGYDKDWYPKHLRKSEEAASGPWKASFAPVKPAELDQLAVYLATCVAAPKLVEAKSVFFASGCLGCHKVSGTGGDEGPELTLAGEKDPGQLNFSAVSGKETVSNWMAEHFRSPGSVVAGSQMPPIEITGGDVDLLTLYALSLRRRDVPGSYLPKDRLRAMRMGEREFASDGATIFGAFCAGCHGQEGKGRHAAGMAAFPAIASPDFQSLVSDDFLKETIRKGRPGRRMPGWDKDGGLKGEEIDQVVAHLRRLAGIASPPAGAAPLRVSASAAAGERFYAASCSGCHGRKGEGGEGPALNNKVLLSQATDGYLVETISRGRAGTAMRGFSEPSVAHRTYTRPEIESIVAFVRSWEGKK